MEALSTSTRVIYSTNYILSAICTLSRFYDKLPSDNQYTLSSNLWNIGRDYADLHKLILDELLRALKAYDNDKQLIDENYEKIKELFEVFENVTCRLY